MVLDYKPFLFPFFRREMVSWEVHQELLKISDETARESKLKALTLKSEVSSKTTTLWLSSIKSVLNPKNYSCGIVDIQRRVLKC